MSGTHRDEIMLLLDEARNFTLLLSWFPNKMNVLLVKRWVATSASKFSRT